MHGLETPLTKVLGGKTADALEDALDLHTVGDLLRHYPRRYAERGERTDLATLEIGEQVTIMAEIRAVNRKQMRTKRGSMLEVTVGDGDRTISLTFFNQAWRERELQPGKWGLFAGKVTEFRGRRQLNGPDYRLLPDPDSAEGAEVIEEFAGALIPVYPAAAKLPSWTIARCVGIVLKHLVIEGRDPLPAGLRAEHKLTDLRTALHDVHRPGSKGELYNAIKRLKWEEAFGLQVVLVRRKHSAAAVAAVPRPLRGDGILAAFDDALPFELTEGQREVGETIAADLATPHPMHRLLQGEVGSGKAQPLDALVLTPSGYREMAEIRVGDQVITMTGEPAAVAAIHPQGTRDIYRVTLSDETSVECDLDHLWYVNTTVRNNRGNPHKVLSLREILESLHVASGGSKWYLPVIEAPELELGLPRPVDPYVLGLLLGDGHLKYGRVGFSSADPELIVELMTRLPKGCHLSKPSYTRQYDWFVLGCRWGRNPLLDQLREIGAYGHGAREKFVPEAYKVAPIAVRHEVLRGLLDTDGTLDSATGTNVSIVSASQRLAADVAWLAESLGGTGRLRPVTKMGRVYYQVSLRLPDRFAPFRLKRKADLVRSRTKYAEPVRAIRSVEFAGRKEAQCLLIDHETSSYITDNFTVTHNTMVSMRAMLQVVDAGAQAALLAPTEVLAIQHHRTITDMLGDRARAGELDAPAEATRVALVTGSQGAKVRKAVLAEVADGGAGIVVGTHALLYDAVDFHDLGLVVVDEQHRFGVEQRDALRAKADVPPHVLVMTATPIPRTVAMTVYGDLEVSSLAQLPKGRSPITTHVVPGGDERWMRRTWQRIREEVQAGHQAYIVCPRIGDDDKEAPAGEGRAGRSGAADEEIGSGRPSGGNDGADGRRPPLAVLDVGPALAEGALHGLRVGILHGKLPPEEKDAVMRAFKNRELDVIVATTVIEVGVDVPNATMMVILDADRFGVSQLHQLRGRVGRGSAAGLCLLVSEAYSGSTSAERLAAVAETTDGFRLAELDLEQRREGDVLGEAQSGHRSQVRLLSLLKDADLIREAREAALALVAEDPELERHPELAATVAALVDDERAEYLEKG